MKRPWLDIYACINIIGTSARYLLPPAIIGKTQMLHLTHIVANPDDRRQLNFPVVFFSQ
jgi:hypothetical protein